MNIKRYETKDNWSNKSGTYIPVFSEDEDGEWVKYSEAKGIIDEYRKIAKDNADWYDCLRIDFKELESSLNVCQKMYGFADTAIVRKDKEIKELKEVLEDIKIEIEKLKKENLIFWDERQSYKAKMLETFVTIKKQQAEIKKLREALKYCDKISGSLIADPLMCIRNKCREALKDGK